MSFDITQHVVPVDQFDAVKRERFDPCFKSLAESKFTMSAGHRGDYWLNMRTEKFAKEAFVNMLNQLQRDMEAAEKNNKKGNILEPPPYYESILYALTHIGFGYPHKFPKQDWEQQFNYLRCQRNMKMAAVLMKLDNTMSRGHSFRQRIDDILDDHHSEILNETVPICILLNLLRTLYTNGDSFDSFVEDFKSRLSMSNTLDQCLVLLHLTEVIMTTFPGLAGKLESWVKPVKDMLAKPSPVSNKASKVGRALSKEAKYPGISYYTICGAVLADNPAFGGAVPFIFNQETQYLANFLSLRSCRFDTIQSCLMNYIDFYLKAKIKTSRTVTPEEAAQLIHKMKFSEKGVRSMKRKLQISEPDIDDETIIADASKRLMPPIFRIVSERLTLNIPFSLDILEKNHEGKLLYRSPCYSVLRRSFFEPIRKQVLQLSGESEVIFQPIVLAGDDLLISNVMTSLVAAYAESPRELAKVLFTWHIVPVNTDTPNEIAAFLGRTDPIYRRFAERIFVTASSIAPKINEETDIIFPSILEQSGSFPNHPWLTDPSPNNLFQFSLHHYLTFGRSATMVNVWKIELDMKNGSDTATVIVPWVTSVHIGTAFSQLVTKERLPCLSDISFLTGTEVQAGPFSREKTKIKSISIWNIEKERNLKPNEEWVIAEWTSKESLTFEKGETRASKENAAKITSKSVQNLTFKSNKLFDIMVDQKIYNNVIGFRVAKMEDPRDPEIQMQLRFATFTECM